MFIRGARITGQPVKWSDPLPEVWVTFDDGSEKKLFSYYPDEDQFRGERVRGTFSTTGAGTVHSEIQ